VGKVFDQPRRDHPVGEGRRVAVARDPVLRLLGIEERGVVQGADVEAHEMGNDTRLIRRIGIDQYIEIVAGELAAKKVP
jgi:hypothetical protein